MACKIDETGNRYGLLLVEASAPSKGDGRTAWLCRCACGVEVVVRGKDLRAGKTQACYGCGHKKHGHSTRALETPEHRAWHNMIQRCRNPNTPKYHRYGGRGIVVSPEWEESFERFYSDVGPRPSPEYSLDRIDNNRGYEPGNVRWATKKQQVTNMEKNVHVTIDGETLVLADWLRRFNLGHKTYYKRVNNGHAPAAALSTPGSVRLRSLHATVGV